MNKKPNIVMILEDHKAYYGHGEMGNGPKIHRPNYQRIVKEGIEFTNAYTACPLCGPARRTMLTGLFPHNNGEIKNESNEKYIQENYLQKLKEEGYNNYYFGKWHAGKGNALDPPFNCEGFSVDRYGNPYTTPEYEAYIKKKNLPFIEVEIVKDFKDLISEKVGIKEGALYKPKFPAYSEYATGIMTTPKETHEAFFLANMACDKLKEFAKNENGKPFHMRIDFWGPHEPYFPSREFADLYNPKDIPEIPSFKDDLKDKPSFYKKDMSRLLTKGNKNNEILIPNPLPWSEWQKVLALNYGEQSLIDAAGGLILDTLEELGMEENTVVIWTSDHGDALACHGGHFDKDSYMPQEMIRVPLAIRYPKIISSGRKSDALVSNIDFAPTFLEFANTKFKNPVDGSSLFPLLNGNEERWREDLFIESHGHFTTILSRSIIYNNFKYTWNANYIDELYDLDNDPFELNNLINENDYVVIKSEMQARLKKWRKKTRDNITLEMIKGKKLKKPKK
jgi:arylsulfatase A-like enzyme